MGVGFQSTSSPWKRRLWAKPSVTALVKEVRRIYGEHLADPLLVERLYSAMGVWQRDRFAIATASEQALSRLGSEFFPWWSQERDASFWLGLGRVVLWCDVAWVTPRDESERREGAFCAALL